METTELEIEQRGNAEKRLRGGNRVRDGTGIKVAMACPSISHLFFTDDSLFFYKSQNEESQKIFRILKEYEAVSDQHINFKKSSI